jgi:hypothetical protein
MYGIVGCVVCAPITRFDFEVGLGEQDGEHMVDRDRSAWFPEENGQVLVRGGAVEIAVLPDAPRALNDRSQRFAFHVGDGPPHARCRQGNSVGSKVDPQAPATRV